MDSPASSIETNFKLHWGSIELLNTVIPLAWYAVRPEHIDLRELPRLPNDQGLVLFYFPLNLIP